MPMSLLSIAPAPFAGLSEGQPQTIRESMEES